MAFLAPAVPWIIKGGTALAGYIGAKRAQKKATQQALQRSPEELQALTGAQGAAAALGTTGQQLIGQGQQTLQGASGTLQEGMEPLRQAGGYWSRLLGGSRAAMQSATAGPRAGITDVYSGARRGLTRSGVRGAARDVASAELGRQEAGQIAGLTTGVQPGAASALESVAGGFGNLGQAQAGIGAQLLGQGTPLVGQAGSIFETLLGQGAQNRQQANVVGQQAGQQTGSAIGSLLFDVLSGYGNRGTAGGNTGWLKSKPLWKSMAGYAAPR